MKHITRRDFLRQTISGVGSFMLVSSLGSGKSLAQTSDGMSRVVVTTHPEATDGVKIINPANVQIMMDESIKQITGEASVADA